MTRFSWRRGYKYQTAFDYTFKTNIKPDQVVSDDFIVLSMNGELMIKKGYAWDGPSGPTFDTKNSMPASCKHDALFQLMRRGLLSRECKDEADAEFYQELLDAGMCKGRAWVWYMGVKYASKRATLAESVKRVFSVE